jgi:uncharacterized membrane protein
MNRKTLAGETRRRKLITALWIAGLSAVVIFLLYKELTAVLYILATLGITIMLIMVAFSDLSHVEGSTDQLGQSRDSSG